MPCFPNYDEQNPFSVDAVDRLVPREFLSVPVRPGALEAGRRCQVNVLDRLEEAVGERHRHGLRQRPVRDGRDCHHVASQHICCHVTHVGDQNFGFHFNCGLGIAANFEMRRNL